MLSEEVVEPPLNDTSSLCSRHGLLSLIKNGVSVLAAFPGYWSDLRNTYPKRPLDGPIANPDLGPRNQNPGGPSPVPCDQVEKFIISENDLKILELKYRRLFETA
jgi:hypothetical protein